MELFRSREVFTKIVKNQIKSLKTGVFMNTIWVLFTMMKWVKMCYKLYIQFTSTVKFNISYIEHRISHTVTV